MILSVSHLELQALFMGTSRIPLTPIVIVLMIDKAFK